MTKRQTPSLEVHWRRDRDVYRVWRSDWVGDQFEVVGLEMFSMMRATCERLSIPFLAAPED